MSLAPEVAAIWQAAEARLLASGSAGWKWGLGALEQRLDLPPKTVARAAAAMNVNFARVVTRPGDPRGFDLAPVGGWGLAALLVPVTAQGLVVRGGLDEPGDVLAMALSGPRFWRAAGRGGVSLLYEEVAAGDVLCLWQDPWAFIRQVMLCWGHKARISAARQAILDQSPEAEQLAAAKAAAGIVGDAGLALRLEKDNPHREAVWAALRAWVAAQQRSERVRGTRHPAPTAPPGLLVLDPAALTWTRKGMLARIEQIEIQDAPVTGPLGRALRRLNPLIGGPRGVRMTGAEGRA